MSKDLLGLASYGCYIEMKKALQSEQDLNIRNDRGWTPLMFAAMGGHLKIVRLLLENGADVNAKDFDSQETALIKTSGSLLKLRTHPYIVKLLLDNGAQANLQNNDFGQTALMIGLVQLKETKVQMDILKILLANGADIHIRDNEGQTALMYAVYWGHLNAVNLLISKGAEINVKDMHGATIFDIAEERGYQPMIDLLKRYRM